ncbi:hypothetical protein SAMN05421770_11229 [Granulicella rosea]|uniref:PIN domain-containing protein n=1 Tax=Granulicella rosea TaxID=474952 RepID=A0A239MFV9_9BACT|nr:hypothetical protein [Granulicella rosea]SNT41370.1 hypothetical protein SAMN05421770_11229 [Granulicella rosea]
MTRFLTPPVVLQVTCAFCDHTGHEFWPDSISLFDRRRIDPTRLLGPKQVADTYLLALAVSRGGQLATFDRRIVTDSVVDGAQALYLIP